ncbi:MAG: hypothetical protein C4318_08405 [Acidimicrobiia bacterium]
MPYVLRAMAEGIATRFACISCGAVSGISPLCSWCEAQVEKNRIGRQSGIVEPFLQRSSTSSTSLWMPFLSCTTPLEYAPPVSHLVVALKRSGSYRCARFLGDRLCKALPFEARSVSFVTWVPSASCATKGFDHGAVLARAVAQSLGVRAIRLLQRIEQEELKHLSREDRLCRAGVSFSTVSAGVTGTVLLVDDVTTTGASLYYAALELKRAGFRKIHAAAVAKTPLFKSPLLNGLSNPKDLGESRSGLARVEGSTFFDSLQSSGLPQGTFFYSLQVGDRFPERMNKSRCRRSDKRT